MVEAEALAEFKRLAALKGWKHEVFSGVRKLTHSTGHCFVLGFLTKTNPDGEFWVGVDSCCWSSALIVGRISLGSKHYMAKVAAENDTL